MSAVRRIAYVEMIGGAAGDMLLAAFLDAGLDAGAVTAALRGVVAEGWTFAPTRVVKRGIAATAAQLVVPGEDGAPDHDHHPHRRGPQRTLADVLGIVERSALTTRQRERASAVYRRLAEAEARVHGVDVATIHFHEVGQIDAVLDVAGFCVALDLLAIDELRCSPFPVGHGTIRMDHGSYPNPPPATADLLRGWPTRTVDVAGELVTTTAAAILTTLATPGPRPDLTVERIGYGAGTSDFAFPNVTRISIGTLALAGAEDDGRDEVVVLEANVDDLSPQYVELALERILAAGARDAWLTPIVMKKGRPALLLSAIADPSAEEAVARAMLRETTTIGVRVRAQRRHILPRRIVTVETPYGPVRAKEVRLDGGVRVQPEYDDLVRIARERGLPLPEVARVVERCLDAGGVR
jgi:uncharacterized protein (TIGR00299 family) protein